MALPAGRGAPQWSRCFCYWQREFRCCLNTSVSSSWDKLCCPCSRRCSSSSSCCLLRVPSVRRFSSVGGPPAVDDDFSAERFHSGRTLQWLRCLEGLAAKSLRPPAKASAAAAIDSAGNGGIVGTNTSIKDGHYVQGGFGWGPGALPPSWLLWRVEERLQRLPARYLVRVAATMKQLGLRDGPSLGGDSHEASKDIALLLLLQLHRHLECALRCLSLREVAMAARVFSSWRFPGESAAAPTGAAAHQQQYQEAGGLGVNPLRLRASTFRLLLASAAAQIGSLGPQQRQSPRGASFLLQLLQGCARLQLTELREEYLLVLPLLQHHVAHTKSLLQLALLLHSCTRLLLPDAEVYRQVLQRLADWPAFELLLQQEQQAAAAQVALGQMALSCVSFAPWQMEALEEQMQRHAPSHHCNTSNISSSTNSSRSWRSLTQLQEAVLLNVCRAAATSIHWPSICTAARDPAAPAKATAPAAATGAAAEDQRRQQSLGPPSGFLLRQLQTAAFAIRHENPALLCRLGAPPRGPLEDETHRQVKRLLMLLEGGFPTEVAGGPRKGRSSSEQHANVAAALEAVGVKPEKEVRVGPYEADLLLPTFRCLIEIDGPLHFIRPPPCRSSNRCRSTSSRRFSQAEIASPTKPLIANPTISTGGFKSEGPAEYRGLWWPLREGAECDPLREAAPVLVYDVKSSLKHRLLQASGWEVLHIAWNDWPRDSHNQHRALAQLLQQTKQRQHHQQQPQGQSPPEGGLAWGGCGGSLLLYKPQFGELLLHERQSPQKKQMEAYG